MNYVEQWDTFTILTQNYINILLKQFHSLNLYYCEFLIMERKCGHQFHKYQQNKLSLSPLLNSLNSHLY